MSFKAADCASHLPTANVQTRRQQITDGQLTLMDKRWIVFILRSITSVSKAEIHPDLRPSVLFGLWQNSWCQSKWTVHRMKCSWICSQKLVCLLEHWLMFGAVSESDFCHFNWCVDDTNSQLPSLLTRSLFHCFSAPHEEKSWSESLLSWPQSCSTVSHVCRSADGVQEELIQSQRCVSPH